MKNPDHIEIAQSLLAEFPNEHPTTIALRMQFAGIDHADSLDALAHVAHATERPRPRSRPQPAPKPPPGKPAPLDAAFLATWTEDLESIRAILRDECPEATEDAICSASIDAIIGHEVQVDHGRLMRLDGGTSVTFYF